jgi:Tfp pilus assembly PilM family ATPase
VARYLALDWDQTQLHVVAAAAGGGGRVTVQQAAVWQEDQPLTAENAEAMGALLKERLKSAGIKPGPVLACVGRDRVIVKEIKYPHVPDAEEPALVRFQAVKELTDSPDDVVLDYFPLPIPDTGSSVSTLGNRRAFVVIVRREVVTTYQKVCQAAGLKLEGLAPRALGIAECVRRVRARRP